MRRMHNEARKQRDQQTLTALTLAIIYMRAERVGPVAQGARDAIHAYLDEWAPVTEENSGVLPPGQG